MDDRLYRSRSGRMISGVAAGLAEHLDVDPSIVRVIWVLLVLPTGFLALLAYVVMAIVVPEEPLEAASLGGPTVPAPPAGPASPTSPVSAEALTEPTPGAAAAPPNDWRAQRRAERQARWAARRAARRAGGGNGAIVFGAILIVIGSIFFVRQFIPAIDFDVFWPSALIALGVVLVIASVRRA